jgi:hypothetical protein
MLVERGGEGGKTLVIEIGPRQIIYIFLTVILLASALLLFTSLLKPRLNLRVELLQNNIVVVSGRLLAWFNPVPGEYVAIEVRSQSGVTVWIDTVKTSSDGYFESAFKLNQGMRGRFNVYASTESVREETSFEAAG